MESIPPKGNRIVPPAEIESASRGSKPRALSFGPQGVIILTITNRLRIKYENFEGSVPLPEDRGL